MFVLLHYFRLYSSLLEWNLTPMPRSVKLVICAFLFDSSVGTHMRISGFVPGVNILPTLSETILIANNLEIYLRILETLLFNIKPAISIARKLVPPLLSAEYYTKITGKT